MSGELALMIGMCSQRCSNGRKNGWVSSWASVMRAATSGERSS